MSQSRAESSEDLELRFVTWSSGFDFLAQNEVKLLVLQFEQPPLPISELLTHLTPPEIERADRYKVEKPRRQFVITRGCLRILLGRLLGVAPARVPIGYSAVGKPVLEGVGDTLQFNVSHTDGLALLAFAHRRVGVDVERVRTLANQDGMVSRFFSKPECEEYFSLDPSKRLGAFFRGWTCKEALIKAVGMSVAYLADFDVQLNPDQPARLRSSRHTDLNKRPWALAAWNEGEFHAAALAVEGTVRLDVTPK
jgi:4'-phosphopantetheinyl transferase